MEFSTVLKESRKARRMSQLDLALEAGVSARHVSFLETGRARPSRGMVLAFADALHLTPAARNRALDAAGFAPVHTAHALSDAALAPVREAVARMLRRHEPYPGFALDAEWTVLSANASALRLFGGIGLAPGRSMLDVIDTAAGAIENWPEVAPLTAARLRLESAEAGGIAALDAMADRLEALGFRRAEDVLPPFVPLRFRSGDAVLSLISTLVQFGGVEDVTVRELRVELFHPADEATATALEWLARGASQ
ncbi:MAG: helix-turn-helix transcriptional regulator [Pseudomonadota bacterium]